LSAHAVLCKTTVDVIPIQYLLITYRESPTTFIKCVRWTFIILHVWWCFSHDLDMVEIKIDNYGTPVSTSKVHLLFRIFKHQILVFLKAK